MGAHTTHLCPPLVQPDKVFNAAWLLAHGCVTVLVRARHRFVVHHPRPPARGCATPRARRAGKIPGCAADGGGGWRRRLTRSDESPWRPGRAVWRWLGSRCTAKPPSRDNAHNHHTAARTHRPSTRHPRDWSSHITLCHDADGTRPPPDSQLQWSKGHEGGR